MAKTKLSLSRMLFLTVIATVFLFAYIADWNVFKAILEIVDHASVYAKSFMMLFLVLSFAGLSVYYYLAKISNREISKRFLKWLMIFSIACFAAFVITSVFVYINIYSDKTFDNT
mgnify:CR=1 FL=1|jgi:hypothetical protein